MDKKTLLDKTALPQQEEKQDEDRLLKLAEKFADFVTKKKDPLPLVEDVTDVMPKEPHALHDERETRLREGISAVSQPPGTNPQSVGTDNLATESQS
jgi:hypothetical protein